MEKLTYHQRLRILELDSLELRRVRADLLFTYKLVFGLIDASLHKLVTIGLELAAGSCSQTYIYIYNITSHHIR